MNSTAASTTAMLTNLSSTTERCIDCNSEKNDQQQELLAAVTSYLWIILSPIILSLGLFGNMSTIAVMIRMKFWKKPTYILLIVLAMSDAIVLSVGLSRYWTREVFKVDLRSLSTIGCKINVFCIYTSMQFSSMMLVCITLERFLKTRFPIRYNIIVSTRKTVALIIILFLFISALNAFWFETQGLVEFEGDLSCEAVTETYFWFEEFVYTYVDLFVLSVLPFFTMVGMNTAIQRVLAESKKLRMISVSDQSTRKELGKFSRVLTRMILFTSTYFLFTTIPISIYFIVDSYLAADADDTTLARLDVAWSVTYLLQYTNYAVNFFVYMVTNKAFKRTFVRMIRCLPSDKDALRKGKQFSSTVHSTVESQNTTVPDDEASDDDEPMTHSNKDEKTKY